MRASGVLTWANVLTLTRLLLCLPLYLLIRSESWLWASVCLFVAAKRYFRRQSRSQAR